MQFVVNSFLKTNFKSQINEKILFCFDLLKLLFINSLFKAKHEKLSLFTLI